jgi:methylenetetrahydrofolate--tRNA-(uracil-5-)-methyltransferase
MSELIVIGGGLAGSEAAWQAAERGWKVILYEMRPAASTGAHVTGNLAELVCSNSLGSTMMDRASGLLQAEARSMGSLLLRCAEETKLPAGGALAVDREAFACLVTGRIQEHPNIRIIRQEVKEIPREPAIIASGPLTSPELSAAIANLTGQEYFFFFDAVAPIVTVDTIDMDIAFRASRYDRGQQEEGDYINCPMIREEYYRFTDELLRAERVELWDLERQLEEGVRAGAHRFFEGCLPMEILARRGKEALAYGPMRPVGLRQHGTKHLHAVVQLRQDNLAGTLYNLVGFQTNLKYAEQQRVFRMIPGLEKAQFVRYGQMHRNTFLFSPSQLRPSLQFRNRDDLFFAGQITGVEGYVGNIVTGLIAGLNAARWLNGEDILVFPRTTMLGALCHYITHAGLADFQPMKANFGIFPELEGSQVRGKRLRARLFSERAQADLHDFLEIHQSIESK